VVTAKPAAEPAAKPNFFRPVANSAAYRSIAVYSRCSHVRKIVENKYFVQGTYASLQRVQVLVLRVSDTRCH